MLSHPALIMTDNRGDTQCVAFLAQQCVAAITRPEGPDFAGLGELHNVLLGVAGPGHVCLPGLKRSAYGVKRLHEEALSFVQFCKHILADSCHNAHRAHHISGVSNFDRHLGVLRFQRAHDKRNDVHGAPAHRAFEKAGERLLHLHGVTPVVGGACTFFGL